MVRKETWKNASYPNAKPSWQKNRINDPLRNYAKANGFAETESQANGMAKALQLNGRHTKIVNTHSGYAVYYN